MTESNVATPITVRENITAQFSAIALTGDIIFYPSQSALALIDQKDGEREIISTNLESAGLEPIDGCVMIKDWSEHSGLTQSLVDMGIVRIVAKYTLGQFNSIAYQVRVLV